MTNIMIKNPKILTDPILIEFVGGLNDGLTTFIPYLKESIDIINHNDDGTFIIRVYILDESNKLVHPKYKFIGVKNA